MVGITGAGDAASEAAQAGERSTEAESHVGVDEFHRQVASTNGELGTLRTGQQQLGNRLDDQGQRLGQAEQGVQQNAQELNRQGGQINELGERTTAVETSTGQHETQLAGHETRLTNLEAGRQHGTTPFQQHEVDANANHVNALRTVQNNDLRDVWTGHNSARADFKNAPRTVANAFRSADNKKPLAYGAPQNEALKERIRNDPMVRLQQTKLNGAVSRMEQANQVGGAGNRADFIKAAEDAEEAAKQLDSTRKGLEGTGVFQSGNRFSKHTTAVNGTLAALSLAGAGTTGGIIAWNNKKQGDIAGDNK